MTPRWSDADLAFLDLHHRRFPIAFIAKELRRSARAVTVMASRRAIERQRVEAARLCRDVSRGTSRGAR